MSPNPLLTHPTLEQLIERTRLIGADDNLVVHGGGNTSSKAEVTLEDGQTRRVMWIKASGGDMATATATTFAPLDLDKIDSLRVHQNLSDEEMVELVSQTSLLAGAPRPSIETLLHGFMPYTHIDHVHADAICALTNHASGREATLEALGDEWAYVEWMRSGFPLSKVVEKMGDYRGVILAHHGVITWADSSDECYQETLRVVSLANEYLDARQKKPTMAAPPAIDLHEALPRVRSHLSAGRPRILRVDERLRDIASREDIREIVSAGVSSADHMLRIRPFSIVLDNLNDESLQAQFAEYDDRYQEYAARHQAHLPEGYELFDGVPRVALIPGVGAVTVGDTLAEATMLADIAFHTHTVAARVKDCFGEVEAMPEEEIFRFEYWPMELYKLSLKPGPKKFSGKMFIVTGAAGGIGRAITERILSLGGAVIASDLNTDGLATVAEDFADLAGDMVTIAGDLTDPDVVRQSVQAAIAHFGGLDGVVVNAGIAVSKELAELSDEDWQRSMDINLTSAFRLTRESLSLMGSQQMGGSLVFIASKNAFAPGAAFGAYSVSKAGLVQLMRIAAIEGGPHGIRSNALNPDAIFDGSELWSNGIREQRAAAHGIEPDQLEDFYATRNLLKVHVRSSDVADATEYLLSEASSRTTGSVIPVDGGVAPGFPR